MHTTVGEYICLSCFPKQKVVVHCSTPCSWIFRLFCFHFTLKTVAITLLHNCPHSVLLLELRWVSVVCTCVWIQIAFFQMLPPPWCGPQLSPVLVVSSLSKFCQSVWRIKYAIWALSISPAGVWICISVTSLSRLVHHWHFSCLWT